MFNFHSMTKRVITGIFGGSFNPIHMGHTAFAQELVATGVVDEMWLVVSPRNPLKADDILWDDNLRLRLARVALEDVSGVEVSDVEFSLPRPSYMVTTLGTLQERYPEREFVLVIGQDNWDCFHSWYHWEEILDNYRVIVIPRNVEGKDGPNGAPVALMQVINGKLVPMPGKRVRLIDMSSTWIRSQISENTAYDGQGLHPEVWRIIRSLRKV